MDLDKILHFVPSHIEQIIVVLTVLFIVTTILLLIRSLKETPQDNSSQVDVRTIEGALKRVLAQSPSMAAADKAFADDGSGPADIAPLKAALAEKEKQLSSLNTELREAKATVAAAHASGGGAAGAPPSDGSAEVNSGAVASLELEITDLKARLAEYEIIEDDIADLALYKEENARLKREIEQARNVGSLRPPQPEADETPLAVAQPPQQPAQQPAQPIIEANAAAGIPGLTEALEAEAAMRAAMTSKAEAPEAASTALSHSEIEELVTPQKSMAKSPLESLGDFDADKMLAEAEALPQVETVEDEPEINALSDLLDTDKLLEEVNSLDAQDVMSEFKDKSMIG